MEEQITSPEGEEGTQDQEARARQRELLERIRQRRFTPPPGAPDSAELLREDRSR